jgi:hypothetical protein
MIIEEFTLDRVQHALKESRATPDSPPGLDSYRHFFLRQPEHISTPRGYGRVLASQYEVNMMAYMTKFQNGTRFGLVGKRLLFVLRTNEEAHVNTYTPLRQAVEVFTTYAAAMDRINAHALDAGHAARQEAYETLPLAARVTAVAFRDIALHQLLSLAGGDAVASEEVLLTGESFTALRELYGVHIERTGSNLNSWRISLLEEMGVMADIMERAELARRARIIRNQG